MPASPARIVLVRMLQRSRAPGLALALSLLGCGGNEAPLPQKPAPAYGIPRQRPTNTAAVRPGQSPEASHVAPEPSPGAQGRARFEEPPLKAAEPGPPSDEIAARDYNAELAQLMNQGVPGCLVSFRPSSASVTIQVTAQVMSSGTVSRADAQAAGLTPAILACIQKLATSVRLKGPVAGAPRSVQAQLTLQTQGAPRAPQLKAAVEDVQEDERDENPRDSKLQQVEDDRAEVEQKLDEPTREAPEPPDPKDEPPADNHTD